jgi:hypothetical protein
MNDGGGLSGPLDSITMKSTSSASSGSRARARVEILYTLRGLAVVVPT